MSLIPKSIKNLIIELNKLPGIGPKSARRLAFHLFELRKDQNLSLAKAIETLKNNVTKCTFCNIVTDTNPCSICADPTRDNSKICIVESSLEVYALEKLGTYDGIYFVLGGVGVPLQSVQSSEIDLKGLKRRVDSLLKKIKEIELIIALSTTIEGQTTMLYIKEMFNEPTYNGRVYLSKIAIGLTFGSSVDYVDSFTLKEALNGRNRI